VAVIVTGFVVKSSFSGGKSALQACTAETPEKRICFFRGQRAATTIQEVRHIRLVALE
jgi:hypothetical protein